MYELPSFNDNTFYCFNSFILFILFIFLFIAVESPAKNN